MASLIELKSGYYARFQWRNKYGKKEDKKISLRTHHKKEAYTRLYEVEKVQEDIKEGLEFSFPWLNNSRNTKILRLTLQDAIDEYHSVKKINGYRDSTIDRSKVGLKSLTQVVDKKIPVDSLNEEHFADWGSMWKDIHKPNTRACNRAKIVSFLNYCYKKKWIPEIIQIDTINDTQTEKKLVNEKTIRKIQELTSNIVSPHYKRAFHFYFSTGCRRAEPFDGILKKSYLVVTCVTAKSKRTRYVQITPMLRDIVSGMKDKYDEAVLKNKYQPKSVHDRYREKFKKACRAIGIEDLHLHNLRNSYISLRIAVTGDIYAVSKEVGHASIKQTEAYALPPLLVADEFPSYKKLNLERLKREEMTNTFNQMLDADFGGDNGLEEIQLEEKSSLILT